MNFNKNLFPISHLKGNFILFHPIGCFKNISLFHTNWSNFDTERLHLIRPFIQCCYFITTVYDLAPEMSLHGKNWTDTQLQQAMAVVRNGYPVGRAETEYNIPRRTLRNHLATDMLKLFVHFFWITNKISTVHFTGSEIKRLGYPPIKLLLYFYYFLNKNFSLNLKFSNVVLLGTPCS